MKVSEVLAKLKADGWCVVVTKGSHRQLEHYSRPGRVTIAGKPSDDIAPEHKVAFSNKRAESNRGMRYAIVIEKAEGNYSAYVPDLPGCIATGPTAKVVEARIREAIMFHLAGMREDGVPPPQPRSQVEYVEVAA